ncbi:opioid growth factor receptor conserved region-domain-containing protein [Lyophyllum atratum]|nr:opioid growth factor receptor conserved region-domain-containing protein [Lyophyllum atratum]
MSIPRDVKEFLEGYPQNENDLNASANYEFYSNNRRCRPDNRLIDEIHEQWAGDYGKLEYKHGYIQWLFPIQEYGMNYESQPLQRHEIEAIKAAPTIIERIISSYRMMLDFYGMRLVSVESGLIDRCLPPRNYSSRYSNLVRSPHNNLRISRILKSLSEFGTGASERWILAPRPLRANMDRWWANCIRNKEERKRVGDLIRKVRNDDDGYVFTRDMYENALSGPEVVVEKADDGAEKADDVQKANDVVRKANGAPEAVD